MPAVAAWPRGRTSLFPIPRSPLCYPRPALGAGHDPSVASRRRGLCYLVFIATFLYLIGLTGDLLVPRSVDRGPIAPPAMALLLDAALIALFGIQHSVMARPAFNRAGPRSSRRRSNGASMSSAPASR